MELIASLFSFALHIDQHLVELASSHGNWIYAILFAIVFCETGLVVTPFLPGDSLLFAGGMLAGTGLTGYPQTAGVLLAAGILGDFVNYTAGRHIGPAIFKRDTRFIKKAHLVKAHAFYELHGGKAIVLARFIPIIRTFAPFVAGIAIMNPAAFLVFNVTGCLIWVTTLVSAGYVLGGTPFVREYFSYIVYAIILLSLLPILAELINSRRKRLPGK